MRPTQTQRELRYILPLGAVGLGLVALKLWQHQRRMSQPSLFGQVALITGASRGLGLLLAHEFARAGCHLAICARDQQQLAWAQRELSHWGTEVLAIPCDVADQTQVNRMVGAVTRHYGGIDILVNNAGIIEVGPIHTMEIADFEQAMDVMYWGMLYTIWAVLPQMRARGQGRIVNITSIGGRVSVPHLLPYSSAKFAAVGLSEGLRAELAQDGIRVTTILPGLMRTGSYLNALFKGRHRGEFTWFSLGSSLPLISMDAERAARQIVEATRRGDAVRVLSIPAIILALFHGLFPGSTDEILEFVNRRILPHAESGDNWTRRGMEIQTGLPPLHEHVQNYLTTWGRKAAARYHQYGQLGRVDIL